MPDSQLAQQALQLSEARMHAVLATAVDAIIVIDDQGIVETFNPAAERLFGFTKEEVIGHNVHNLMPEPYRGEHDEYLDRYRKTGERKIIGLGREVSGRRKDGSTFPADLAVSEAWLAERRIFVGIVRDISERKESEAALVEGNKKLEDALAALRSKNDEVQVMTQQLWQAAKLATVGELAASIAHELNNPLATVTLRIESLLSQTPSDDPRRRPLEIIEQETERMGHLVANLLQFSRRGHRQISSVDVADELVKSLELISHHMRQRRIQVVEEFLPKMPIIQADRQQVRQIFLNLLTNASDAMPDGGTLTLRTTLDTLASGRTVLVIEFADTGVGISPENLPKVMDPFFTTKEEGRGTGLGLAICRRAVQEHGGTVHIASELGKGTTLRVALPIDDTTHAQHLRDQ